MTFEEMKKTLADSEKQVVALRDQAKNEDCSDSTRLELRNLIERRVSAFVEGIKLPASKFLELVAAMREAGA